MKKAIGILMAIIGITVFIGVLVMAAGAKATLLSLLITAIIVGWIVVTVRLLLE